MVEGDALELVRALARDQGGEAVVHPRFGTATYRNGPLTFDLATARTDSYSRPGVLPDVRPGPIQEDLARRDFTVNAMALHLSPPDAGKLLDRFGGRQDVEDKLVRVIHDDSFVDDPTRIMRSSDTNSGSGSGSSLHPRPPVEGPHLLPQSVLIVCAESLNSSCLTRTRVAPSPRPRPRRPPYYRSRLHLDSRISELFRQPPTIGQVEPAAYLALPYTQSRLERPSNSWKGTASEGINAKGGGHACN